MCEASVKPTILHQKTLGLEYELPFYQGFVRLVPVKIECTHRVNIPICNNYRAPKQQNSTTTKFISSSFWRARNQGFFRIQHPKNFFLYGQKSPVFQIILGSKAEAPLLLRQCGYGGGGDGSSGWRVGFCWAVFFNFWLIGGGGDFRWKMDEKKVDNAKMGDGNVTDFPPGTQFTGSSSLVLKIFSLIVGAETTESGDRMRFGSHATRNLCFILPEGS